MATAPNLITPDEYLQLERASDEKHEYLNGRMFAMAGANKPHRKIMGNVYVSLTASSQGTGCIPDNSETRLFIPATGLYTYADAVLTCGEEQYQDDALDTLLNPTLIVEVLSPSTEAYDRGKKFQGYRSIPSFSEYLLIAQNEVLVEYHLRQAGGEWTAQFHQAIADTVILKSSGIALPLSAIYEGVAF